MACVEKNSLSLIEAEEALLALAAMGRPRLKLCLG